MSDSYGYQEESMKDYREISPGQAYDQIGKEIAIQLSGKNLSLHEIRFIKISLSHLLYKSYVLESGAIPLVEGFSFIGSTHHANLGQLVDSELDMRNLPKEIRVINPRGDYWGIFFKR
jgi:hypothetical protein